MLRIWTIQKYQKQRKYQKSQKYHAKIIIKGEDTRRTSYTLLYGKMERMWDGKMNGNGSERWKNEWHFGDWSVLGLRICVLRTNMRLRMEAKCQSANAKFFNTNQNHGIYTKCGGIRHSPDNGSTPARQSINSIPHFLIAATANGISSNLWSHVGWA